MHLDISDKTRVRIDTARAGDAATEKTAPGILADLLHPTPSGARKLIAAWDGLHAETRMRILQGFLPDDAPASIDDDLLDKALGDENGYVRYLAVRAASGRLGLRTDEPLTAKTQRQRAEADPDPLVRFALLEGSRPDPERFFAVPQEARLAVARGLSRGAAHVAKIVEYAMDNQFDNGTGSETELCDLLFDYLRLRIHKVDSHTERFVIQGLRRETTDG